MRGKKQTNVQEKYLSNSKRYSIL